MKRDIDCKSRLNAAALFLTYLALMALVLTGFIL